MKKLLEFTTTNNSLLYVEVEDNSIGSGAVRGGLDQDRSILAATKKLESALQPLKDFSNDVINSIRDNVNAPDETVIEMGLKFSAKAGIIVTSVDGEANLKITLRWKKA